MLHSTATPSAELQPGRTYNLLEVAAFLGVSAVSLQARLRRAERRCLGAPRTITITPTISAFRFCGGREWRFCAREGAPHPDADDD